MHMMWCCCWICESRQAEGAQAAWVRVCVCHCAHVCVSVCAGAKEPACGLHLHPALAASTPSMLRVAHYLRPDFQLCYMFQLPDSTTTSSTTTTTTICPPLKTNPLLPCSALPSLLPPIFCAVLWALAVGLDRSGSRIARHGVVVDARVTLPVGDALWVAQHRATGTRCARMDRWDGGECY